MSVRPPDYCPDGFLPGADADSTSRVPLSLDDSEAGFYRLASGVPILLKQLEAFIDMAHQMSRYKRTHQECKAHQEVKDEETNASV